MIPDVIKMKYIKYCIKRSEKESRIILTVYFIVSVIILSAVIFFRLFYYKFFPDFTTGLYWINELLLLFNGLTSAFIIPVMLFEIMCIYLGIKQE